MNKSLILTVVACGMALYACKKTETVVTTVTPPPETVVIDTTPAPVKTIDPIALSAALKIGYGGTSVKGSFPASSADAAAPKLDPDYNNRIYSAVKNRYVVIFPRTTAGYVAGYYLTVNGADSYYKIDYPAFVAERKAARQQKYSGLRENGGHEDSSIVIKLPADIKGDTFTISYAAYDLQNRVSNTISAIVRVIGSKDTNDDSKLIGSWKVAAYRYNNQDWQEDYEVYKPTTPIWCNNGELFSYQNGEFLGDIPYASYRYTGFHNFGAQNVYSERIDIRDSVLNYDLSSCSKLVYEETGKRENLYSGGYSYDASSKKITLIYDENGSEYADNTFTESYYVEEINATKMVIYKKEGNRQRDQPDIYTYRLIKQ